MRKIKLVLLSSLLATSVFLSTPTLALAEKINIKPEGVGTITELTFEKLITGSIRFLILIAAVVFFFVLVVGGIQWIVSGGDKTGSENARKKITSALVGLAIVFSAWAIIQLIGALFGINILEFTIPSLIPTV